MSNFTLHLSTGARLIWEAHGDKCRGPGRPLMTALIVKLCQRAACDEVKSLLVTQNGVSAHIISSNTMQLLVTPPHGMGLNILHCKVAN